MRIVVNVKACGSCPMFAESCGQYEENVCQHPHAGETHAGRMVFSETEPYFYDYYEKRHPKCPLDQGVEVHIVAD